MIEYRLFSFRYQASRCLLGIKSRYIRNIELLGIYSERDFHFSFSNNKRSIWAEKSFLLQTKLANHHGLAQSRDSTSPYRLLPGHNGLRILEEWQNTRYSCFWLVFQEEPIQRRVHRVCRFRRMSALLKDLENHWPR